MPTSALVRGALAFLLGFTLVLGVLGMRAHGATTLLPNGEQCFQQATGPVSSGSVNMYIPGTTIIKNTWQDAGQTILNTSPIQLDANGCAIIYGVGQYRQQLYSGPVVGGVTTGNLIFDLVTADTSSFNSVFWAGTSGGTPNTITVTDAGFNTTDGSVINFIALNTNTGAATLNVSGTGAIPIQTPSSAGPIAITSGCIAATNPVSVVYSSSAAAFLLLTPCQAGSGPTATVAVPQPGGYLTLSSSIDSPIITADTTGATKVYYTPYVGNQIPIWNGTSYSIFSFTQLILTLSASNVGNTLYDVCVFSNNGTPTAVTGPAWSNSTAGASARGTTPGTPQLQRLNGLWVNALQITGLNGAASFTISANQCTYIGTILIDQTAGQVSGYLSAGQNRKWGVWNAYNRNPIQVQVTDPTVGGWAYATATFRFSNGTSGNGFTALQGLPEELYNFSFEQNVSNGGSVQQIGIGINSVTSPVGFLGSAINAAGIGTMTIGTTSLLSPTLGIIIVNGVEKGATSGQFYSTVPNMLLSGRWRG